MKSSTKTLFVLGCTCAITTSSLFAQVYTFDEFGNSSSPTSFPPISSGVLQPDPSGGLTVPVLVYTVPLPLVPGDVVLTEPGQPIPGPFSDVVRFWNPNGINLTQIIFYSDASAADPADSPADTGLPQQLINPVLINEVGPEGNNGAIYTPPAGAPGSTLAGVTIQYNIISDVPEPSAVALTIVGAGLLLVTLKKRYQTN